MKRKSQYIGYKGDKRKHNKVLFHKRVRRYFSLHEIQKEAAISEETYSSTSYVIQFLMIAVSMLVTGILFRLQIAGTLVIIGLACCCIPACIRIHFQDLKSRKEFSDVDLYIHQMAYSFQRNPKINIALQDTEKIIHGPMQNLIIQAIGELRHGVSATIYRDALNYIEQDYGCSRITALHDFLINIEEKGGKHQNAVDVLLWDFDNWVKRVYKHQENRKRVKLTSEIGLILCLFLSLSTNIITLILNTSTELNMRIDHELLYQISATAFLAVCILYYLYIQKRFLKDWIQKERSDQVMMKDYEMSIHGDCNKIRMRSLPIYATGIAITFVCLLFGRYIFGVVALSFTIILFLLPTYNIRQAKKRTQEDVYLCFTEWLRDVAINLQEEPLQVAIEDTFDHCPSVLKESLRRFIYAMENDPSDVTAYYNFLSEFDILDISTTIRTLYAISIQETDHMDETINALVKRNYEMIDKHEQLQNDDSISLLQFCEYIPTIFVSAKIAIDMMLIIFNYL